jgi:hypothetical protein
VGEEGGGGFIGAAFTAGKLSFGGYQLTMEGFSGLDCIKLLALRNKIVN